MKRIALLLMLFYLGVNISGQTVTDKKNMIGSHIAFGKGYFNRRKVGHGGGGIDNKYYYTLGIDYSRKLSKRFDLCSGMEYTHNNMTWSNFGIPPIKENFKLVTIPAQFKYHLGKYIYFNGGLFVNVLAKYSRGEIVEHNVNMLLGWGLGAGFEYEFDSGVVLSLNPYFRDNRVGEVKNYSEGFKSEYFVFQQTGVSLGVGYKF